MKTIVMHPDRLARELFEKVQEFVLPLCDELEALGFTPALTEIDHVCYRVRDLESYESFKRGLKKIATKISEAWINGRPIAVYKLKNPIRIGRRWSIDLFELPAPRADVNYDEGFEHIEFVTSCPLEEFLAAYNQVSFDRRNFAAKLNRDVSLKFRAGLVKFHEASLEHIIARENAVISAQEGQKVAVFDLDDTLVVSREAFLEAIHAAFEAYFQSPVDFEKVRAKARPTFLEFFAGFNIRRPDAIQEVLQKFQEAWPKFAGKCHVPVGVATMISCLAAEGVELHLWTARDEVTARKMLADAELDSHFAAVHAFAGDKCEKPEPTAQLRAACRSACKIVMVGDSPCDVLAAKAIGAEFFQAGWARRLDLEVAPAAVCQTPPEALVKIIRVLHA